MINLYTIGFAGKSAENFFDLLQDASVKKIIDTRINNVSQLAGFAKGADMKYFARKIGGMDYVHQLDFAPTKELLSGYREKRISWEQYEVEYLNLLDMRKIVSKIDIEQLHGNCLLCSEHGPQKCHRRLLAEYLQQVKGGIEILHLQ